MIISASSCVLIYRVEIRQVLEREMSKKYKRQIRKEAPSAANPTAASSRTGNTTLPVFNPDYTYILKDLRRIGVLAGTFVAILVILSFILK